MRDPNKPIINGDKSLFRMTPNEHRSGIVAFEIKREENGKT